ncbi:glycosyltransferase [Candidatus Woesebacteria bacterium]|nr:glycosyltransferase [Candidatus Woesebacteria bacterium]
MVSVIVTTRNSIQTIELCLKSIAAQSVQNTELIVVDNHSTDATIAIARKYTSCIFQHGPERSAQRNFGAKKAQGKYLLFLDSDMELSPNVIAECLEAISRGACGIYIPEIIAGNTLWSKVRTFERSFYNGTVIDAVRFVTKEVFEKTKGFDEALTGPEDWDFDKRVRQSGKTAIISSPLYHHEENLSLKLYLSKKTYYSQDFEKYVLKWGKQESDVKKQFGIWYRFIGVFVELGKWKKLVADPHLTFLMYLLRIAIGISFLRRKICEVN